MSSLFTGACCSAKDGLRSLLPRSCTHFAWAQPWALLDRVLLPWQNNILATDHISLAAHVRRNASPRSSCGSGAGKGEVREQLGEAALFVRARVRQLQHAVREVQRLTEALQCMHHGSARGRISRAYVQDMAGEVLRALKHTCMS